MIKKKYLFIMSVFIILLLVFFCFFLKNSKEITFKINGDFDENISVLVDKRSVFMRPDNIIIPTTMTTLRPVSVTVGNVTKKIKVKKLSKQIFIPVEIIFKNKKVKYFIQTLPEMFPEYSIDNHSNQSGYILTSLIGELNKDPSYCTIMDTDGNILFYQGHSSLTRSVFHLKRFELPDGKIRYATHFQCEEKENVPWVFGYYYILDEKFNIIDKVKILKTEKHDELFPDEHDIIVLGDGHYIVTGYISKYSLLKNGKKFHTMHCIIQEQKNKQVLLDWDSEEIPLLRNICYEKCPGIDAKYPDYVHVNSMSIDPKDSNLIISSASGYYIMKINRKTGKTMWILGGKANQFNIPSGFNFMRQHDAQYLSDGRLAIFDNHHIFKEFLCDKNISIPDAYSPDKTRLLFFDLDEQNKKIKSAEKIPVNIFSFHMGSLQQIDNDKWLIGCGISKDCSARIINNQGDVLWEMKTNQDTKMYKAYYYKSLDK